MEDTPEFRKHCGYTAFVEGWACIRKVSGAELGFYKDPYSKFGQLTYEMLARGFASSSIPGCIRWAGAGKGDRLFYLELQQERARHHCSK